MQQNISTNLESNKLMDNNLLEKHKNDPAWAEVMRLYSGLFDTQDERETFILDVAEEDTSLATECKLSSGNEEFFLKNSILTKAIKQLKDYKSKVKDDFTHKSAMTTILSLGGF